MNETRQRVAAVMVLGNVCECDVSGRFGNCNRAKPPEARLEMVLPLSSLFLRIVFFFLFFFFFGIMFFRHAQIHLVLFRIK